MVFVFGGTGMAYAYTVTYDCGFYTGTAPASATATANAPFTPAANTCVAPSASGANFTGWLVSGTSDIKQPGTPFTWEYDEDKTFVALWSCYWNSDETACEPGYEITLTNGLCINWDAPPEPDKLYTIHNVGVFRDAARTEKMEPQVNSAGGQYPVTMPIATLTVHRDTQTNRPMNPAIGEQYTVSSMEAVHSIVYYHGGPTGNNHYIHDGYITQSGDNIGKNLTDNDSWSLSTAGNSSVPLGFVPNINGYTGHWYDNVEGQGNYFNNNRHPARFWTWCSKEATAYAHWTPKKYKVTYNKGAHAAAGSNDYEDEYDSNTGTGGATYDSPYTPLSFSSTPISNSMSADTGYVFVGWTTVSTPTFTNGVLNNQYTGDTWWKRDSGLTLYAAYDCANGYSWNSNHTACEITYTLTYNCGTGGSGQEPVDPNSPYSSGSLATIAPDEGGCSNNGFPFNDWYCENSNDDWVPYYNNEITMDDNITCYARWNTEFQYTLTYDCGSGNGNPPSDQYGFNGYVTLATNTCTGPSGHTFGGWVCYETAQGIISIPNTTTLESAGGNYYLGADTTCVARWTEENPCNPGEVLTGRIEVLGMDTEDPMNANDEWNDTGITLMDLFEPNLRPLCTGCVASPNMWTLQDSNNNNHYGVGFNDGNHKWAVEIAGRCSSVQGTPGEPGNPTSDVNGQYCWCSVVGYCPTNDYLTSIEEITPLSGYPWVYLEPYGNPYCDDDACAGYCTDIINGEWEWMKWQNIQTGFWSHFLYSMYTKNICEYALTYNCGNNGILGESALAGGYYQGGQQLTLSNPCTVPTGQTFDYWSCDNNIGNLQGNTVNPTPYNNMTCTAYWRNLPTLTYNCNTSYHGINSQQNWTGPYYQAGQTITLWSTNNNGTYVGSCEIPSNMIFVKWNCSYNSGTDGITNNTNPSNSITMPAGVGSDVVCEGEWACENGYVYNGSTCVPQYSVTYTCGSIGGSALSGSVVPAANSSSYTAGTTNISLTSANNVDTSGCSGTSGYTFNGWNCHQSGQSGTVNSGYTISTMPAYDVICDAVWGYTLKYDCGAGTGDQWVAGTYTIGTSHTGSTPSTASGHCTAPAGHSANVTSWNCGGQNTNVTPGNSITISDNTTCVAQWTPNTYPLTYSCGTASGSDWSGGTYQENVLVSVLPNASNCTPSTGQVFTGYNCTYGSPSTTLTLNQCSLSGLDASIYNQQQLQYGYISADGSNTLKAAEYGLTQNGTWADKFSYGIIRGESKCSSTTGTYPQPGNPSDTPGKYCWCKVTGYTPNNQNMCSVVNSSGWVFERGDFGNTNTCQEYCTGSCASWLNANDRTDFRTAMFAAAGTSDNFTMPASSVTCTAQWDCDSANGYYWNGTACVNTHTLTYVANAPTGATVNGMPNPLSYVYATAATVTLASAPTASGYLFNGWLCQDTGNNTVSQSYNVSNNQASITMPASNVTCTAQWIAANVCLRWDDNGATTAHSGTQSDTCQYDVDSLTAPTTIPTRTGYTFNGWKVTDWSCNICGVPDNINGIWGVSREGVDRCIYNNFVTTQEISGCMESYFTNLGSNQWKVGFGYGLIEGTVKCSAKSGNNGNYSWPSPSSNWTATESELTSAGAGNYCWCHITNYTLAGGNQCNATNGLWVFVDKIENSALSCPGGCSNYCAHEIGQWASFRSAIFGRTQ